ncbi:MAG: hypothetical protein D6719_04610 [Candidatus Dadabacteria bacterium]|nr:MAG: hypothetical protein D6719_04610 [Candidatus Dadabacteria bacterium]
MNRLHLLLVTGFLTACAISLFYYKAFILRFPILPDEESQAWIVEAHISFNARGRSVMAELFIPKNYDQFLIMDESFISRGYGLSTHTENLNRKALWSIRKAYGRQGLYYRAIVHRNPVEPQKRRLKRPKLPESGLSGVKLEAAREIISRAREKSANTESFVRRIIEYLNERPASDNVKLLLGKRPDQLKKAKTAASLVIEAGIPARVAHGVFLVPLTEDAPLVHRLEVFDNGKWLSFDPGSGETTVPENFLRWWQGPYALLSTQGVYSARVNVGIQRYQEEAELSAVEEARLKNPNLIKFSLLSLPLETQSVYRILLMVPIGALIVVILRNIIGLKTFGTFMPVLIALAFRETELIWGIVFFTVIIGVGLLVRSYLEHLKLLLVPRIAAILTVVVLLMMLVSIITHLMDIERGLSVALFPMVIMSMTIERMSTVWDELGAWEALKHGAGSLFVAAIVYSVIKLETLQYIVFMFPETLLVVLALALLLGRYSGYRLLELGRFRALTRG